jgi:hypothetical protein
MTVRELISALTNREVNAPTFEVWEKAHRGSQINIGYNMDGAIRDNAYVREKYTMTFNCECGERYTLVLEYNKPEPQWGLVICLS